MKKEERAVEEHERAEVATRDEDEQVTADAGAERAQADCDDRVMMLEGVAAVESGTRIFVTTIAASMMSARARERATARRSESSSRTSRTTSRTSSCCRRCWSTTSMRTSRCRCCCGRSTTAAASGCGCASAFCRQS